MEKVDLHTADIAEENAAKLAELFPDVVIEVMGPNGELRHSIDVEALKAHVGDVAEDMRERYQFTWPGKQRARAEAMRPIDKTLRPRREKSVNWDDTQNLYIEGDNLDALKILREAYAGKVKMIYIDPPYNTGHDFVYNDSFARSAQEEREDNAAFDDEGNLLDASFRENKETNGRFHSDWCSMMYPRLVLARDLLSEDGVIFMSIDDYEDCNARKLLDEVFGAGNFIAQLIWERAFSPKNDAKYVSNRHDYVLMVAKSADSFKIGRLERTAEANARYSNPDNDPRGVWMSNDMTVKTYNEACDYPIETPSGRIVEPPAGRCWSLSKKAFFERLQDNRIWFGSDGNGVPRIKRFLSELKFDGMAPTSILFYKEVGHSQEGAKEVVALFDGKGYFDGPKPVRLLERLITLGNLADNSIVLDFFSGSGTTAHALMRRNAEKGTHAKLILVQLPEKTDEKREACRAGYKTICEIGEERIRRAGAKIVAEVEEGNAQLKIGEEPKELPDVGFRVFKVDSSNFEDVAAEPGALRQDSLFDRADNLKDGRSAEDILYQLFPRYQIPYSAPVEAVEVCGRTVYKVGGDELVACFDRDVPEEVVRVMAELRPTYAVMRDTSFAGDDALSNFAEIFKTLSPETVAKVV